MLEELTVKVGADIQEFNKKMSQLQNRLNELSAQMQEVGQNLSQSFTLPLSIAGVAMIKFSSDMEESLNKVRVAFGDSAKSVQQWSETSIRSMGLASGSALDAAALFGDMATSMGIGRDEAAKMSMRLVQLGADMASFKNVPIEQAMGALAGVFTGETESLKLLGIVMLETSLQAFALTQGITKKIEKMTEAEKVALRYAYVLSVTKNSQGDFQRTSEGAANQMRMFGENLKQLAVVYGQEILPVFTSILKEVNQMLVSFGELPKTTKQIILVFGGLAAVVGPILIGLGALAAIAAPVIAGLSSIYASLTLFAAGLIAIPPAVAAVGIAIGGITAWSMIMSAWQKDGDRIMALFNRTLESVKNNLIIFGNTIGSAFDNARLGFQKFLMFFSNGSDQIASDYLDLTNKVKTNQMFREQENQIARTSLVVSEYRYQLALLNEDLEQLIAKQNENAGKTDYMTSMEIIRNEQTQKSLDLNKKLIESQKKLIETNKELAEQQKQSVTNLGNAIEKALSAQYQRQFDLKVQEVKKFEMLDIQKTNDLIKRANQVFENEISKAKEASKVKIDQMKNELKEKLKLQDKEFANEIQFLEDIIKAEEDKTKRENEQMQDEARLSELNRKKEFMATADNAKALEMLAKKNAAAIAKTELEADIKSEKDKEEANRIRQIQELEANAKIERARMTHTYNQRLQSAKDQEAARKVVADFEYARVQDEIDLNSRLEKIKESSLTKQAEIELKYAEKFAAIDEKLKVDIASIDKDFEKEKASTLESIAKEQSAHERTLLLRTRDNNIKIAQQAIEAAQKRARTQRETLEEETRVQVEAEDVRLQNEILALNNLKAEVDLHYQNRLTDLDKFHANKLEKVKSQYTELMNEENLQEQVRRTVIGKNQDKIIELLKTYNPSWLEVGRTYGQQLIDGLIEKKSSMEKIIKDMMKLVPTPKATPAPKVAPPPPPDSNSFMGQMNAIESYIPPFLNVNMDGKSVASVIAPHMTDQIRAKTGAR